MTPTLRTSEESDVLPLSSPSLSTSSFDRSCSMSIEACDNNPDQNIHVIAVDGGGSGTSELEICKNVVVESNLQGGRF